MHAEDDFKRRKQKRAVILFSLLICLMVSYLMFPRLFLQAEIEAVVIASDSPASCRSRSSILLGPKQRSSTPRTRAEYCGYITTDHGSLFLPESSRLQLFSKSREELHGQLASGCRYTFTVYGYGEIPQKQRGIFNRGRRKILDVQPVDQCSQE